MVVLNVKGEKKNKKICVCCFKENISMSKSIIPILNDLKLYTDHVCIRVENLKHNQPILLYFFDYLQTFIYVYTSSILFQMTETELSKDIIYINISIEMLLKTFNDQNQVHHLTFVDNQTLCIDNIQYNFHSILTCMSNINETYLNIISTNKPLDYSVESPGDLIKYSANIAILSSPCTVSIERKNEILYLKCTVQQEIGRFVNMFKLQKLNTCVGNDTVNISLKSLRIIMQHMTRNNVKQVTCSITHNVGICFKVHYNNDLYLIFICQHIL
jgi:hypothetical protein